MVSLTEVQASNARIASCLPPGLVAVFVGATSGIGETSLKQFAKHCSAPRIYFIGRSQEAGDRIAAELKSLNAEGRYTFIKADVSLIRVVDDVCREIKSKETAINLLVMSQGTFVLGTETTEGLHMAMSLSLYSRTRFTLNLLPHLRSAPRLRRVITVLGAGYEGPIFPTDFPNRNLPFRHSRGHMNSMATLSLEAIAQTAPDVTFINACPGLVDSGLLRGTTGLAMFAVRVAFRVMMPFVGVPNLEVGERFAFLATSARYPPGARGGVDAGVPVAEGLAVPVVRGTGGDVGGGVYSLGQDGESSGAAVEAILTKLRGEGMVEKVWAHIEEEFKRITGVVAV